MRRLVRKIVTFLVRFWFGVTIIAFRTRLR